MGRLGCRLPSVFTKLLIIFHIAVTHIAHISAVVSRYHIVKIVHYPSDMTIYEIHPSTRGRASYFESIIHDRTKIGSKDDEQVKDGCRSFMSDFKKLENASNRKTGWKMFGSLLKDDIPTAVRFAEDSWKRRAAHEHTARSWMHTNAKSWEAEGTEFSKGLVGDRINGE